MTDHGPDDMGDDEQEFEVAEYEQYIEDPPDEGLVIAEDDDDDAEQAEDWAARHPRAAISEDVPDEAAEDAAIHEIPRRTDDVTAKRDDLAAEDAAIQEVPDQ